jgi:hypothetical protein
VRDDHAVDAVHELSSQEILLRNANNGRNRSDSERRIAGGIPKFRRLRRRVVVDLLDVMAERAATTE